MPIYQVNGIDLDGGEFQERVEAPQARAAADRFRRRGCSVRSALLASPAPSERDCPCCGLKNEIQTIRCKACRSTLRGQTVDPAQRIDLPPGYHAQHGPDDTFRVHKIGWFWWRRYLVSLLAVSVVLLGGGSVLLAMADASDRAFLVLGITTMAVTVPCFAWALCGSRGWIVKTGALRTWARLPGRTFTCDYADAAFRVERRISGGYEARSPRRWSWCVVLETEEYEVTICTESTPERARAVATFLAQNTGWPLDDCLERQ